MSASALVEAPPALAGSGFDAATMLPYHYRLPKNSAVRSFGGVLEPRYIFGADSLDQ